MLNVSCSKMNKTRLARRKAAIAAQCSKGPGPASERGREGSARELWRQQPLVIFRCVRPNLISCPGRTDEARTRGDGRNIQDLEERFRLGRWSKRWNDTGKINHRIWLLKWGSKLFLAMVNIWEKEAPNLASRPLILLIGEKGTSAMESISSLTKGTNEDICWARHCIGFLHLKHAHILYECWAMESVHDESNKVRSLWHVQRDHGRVPKWPRLSEIWKWLLNNGWGGKPKRGRKRGGAYERDYQEDATIQVFNVFSSLMLIRWNNPESLYYK